MRFALFCFAAANLARRVDIDEYLGGYASDKDGRLVFVFACWLATDDGRRR